MSDNKDHIEWMEGFLREALTIGPYAAAATAAAIRALKFEDTAKAKDEVEERRHREDSAASVEHHARTVLVQYIHAGRAGAFAAGHAAGRDAGFNEGCGLPSIMQLKARASEAETKLAAAQAEIEQLKEELHDAQRYACCAEYATESNHHSDECAATKLTNLRDAVAKELALATGPSAGRLRAAVEAIK